MSEGWAAVDGGRLWLERAGEGYPVVFVHPSLFDSRIWSDQFETFARRHDVVRYDRRGFGRSDAPTAAYSDVADLRAVLAELGISRCALVGCAGGARVAIDLALADPDVVEAVVAVSPRVSGYRWSDPGFEVLTAEVRRAVRGRDLETAVDLELAVWAPSTAAANPRVRAIALENAGALEIDPGLRDEPSSAVERLGELQGAMLLVLGDADIGEVDAIAEMVVGAVPGATKRVVAEADQLVNVARPERFDRLVLDFLAFRSLGA